MTTESRHVAHPHSQELHHCGPGHGGRGTSLGLATEEPRDPGQGPRCPLLEDGAIDPAWWLPEGRAAGPWGRVKPPPGSTSALQTLRLEGRQVAPRSPGYGGHGARARVRTGPPPPWGQLWCGENVGLGPCKDGGDTGSLRYQCMETGGDLDPSSKESAVGGDPRRAAPLFLPHPHTAAGRPRLNITILQERTGRAFSRASGAVGRVTRSPSEVAGVLLLQGQGSKAIHRAGTAGVRQEGQRWAWGMSFTDWGSGRVLGGSGLVMAKAAWSPFLIAPDPLL